MEKLKDYIGWIRDLHEESETPEFKERLRIANSSKTDSYPRTYFSDFQLHPFDDNVILGLGLGLEEAVSFYEGFGEMLELSGKPCFGWLDYSIKSNKKGDCYVSRNPRDSVVWSVVNVPVNLRLNRSPSEESTNFMGIVLPSVDLRVSDGIQSDLEVPINTQTFLRAPRSDPKYLERILGILEGVVDSKIPAVYGSFKKREFLVN